jgi:aryl-alcohol dehydrogenase-like predicted oxidoreductase
MRLHQQTPGLLQAEHALWVFVVGIGTAPIGSTPGWRIYCIYWGPQDESEAIRAIEAALDLGVNWIDTAPFYGCGRAEQIVGKTSRGKRDRVYIFTKCGTPQDWQGGDREEYSLLNRAIERDVLPFSQQHGIGVLCWSPLASGFLQTALTLRAWIRRISGGNALSLWNRPFPVSSIYGLRSNPSPRITTKRWLIWQLPGFSGSQP